MLHYYQFYNFKLSIRFWLLTTLFLLPDTAPEPLALRQRLHICSRRLSHTAKLSRPKPGGGGWTSMKRNSPPVEPINHFYTAQNPLGQPAGTRQGLPALGVLQVRGIRHGSQRGGKKKKEKVTEAAPAAFILQDKVPPADGTAAKAREGPVRPGLPLHTAPAQGEPNPAPPRLTSARSRSGPTARTASSLPAPRSGAGRPLRPPPPPPPPGLAGARPAHARCPTGAAAEERHRPTAPAPRAPPWRREGGTGRRGQFGGGLGKVGLTPFMNLPVTLALF